MQFQTATVNQYVLKRISRALLIQRLINGKVVIIGSTPNPAGRLFNIQNYIHDGRSYIPVFSDITTARRLFGRAHKKPGMTFWVVGGRVLFGLFQKNEWVIINACGTNAVEFHANEFRPYLLSRHTAVTVMRHR